jgi:anthranilate/para-aminobenzoate synthase component II
MMVKYRIEEVSQHDCMIVHEFFTLVGKQFYPEYYDGNHSDGHKIIQNFLSMVDI